MFNKTVDDTRNYSKQMKIFSSEIIVLACVTTSESYGSLSENWRISIAALLSTSLKSRFISEFSRFCRIEYLAIGK